MRNEKKSAHEIGCAYERLAGAYLEKCGYQILQYNFRCRSGEVDIIAKDGEYLVFCEVKYRAGAGSGSPLEAVTPAKQRNISRAAMYYLTREHITDCPCRFDVVGIMGKKIKLIKHAFDYMG